MFIKFGISYNGIYGRIITFFIDWSHELLFNAKPSIFFPIGTSSNAFGNIRGNVEGDRVNSKEKACSFSVSVSNDSQPNKCRSVKSNSSLFVNFSVHKRKNRFKMDDG